MLIPFLPHPNCAGKVHGQDKPTWAAELGCWGVIGAVLLKKAQAFITVCAIEGCVLLQRSAGHER